MMRLLMHALAPAGRGAKLSVLMFHRVHAEPDPLFPGEPHTRSFEQKMDWLKRWFNVLPLAEAVAGLRDGKLPSRPAVITFDDGYADNRNVALPILLRLGLPATFFVCTGFMDGGRMWNDTVIETLRRCAGSLLDLRPLDLGVHPIETVAQRRSAIARLIGKLKYLLPAERQSRVNAIAVCADVDLPDDLMMSSSQLQEMVRAGMTIGAHTVHHPILQGLPEDEVLSELLEGRRRLEQITGGAVRFFAYPNGIPGRDYSAVQVQLVRQAGFEAAVTTARGAARHGCDLFQIPRFTPWDSGGLRFGLRLANNLRQVGYATA